MSEVEQKKSSQNKYTQMYIIPNGIVWDLEEAS